MSAIIISAQLGPHTAYLRRQAVSKAVTSVDSPASLYRWPLLAAIAALGEVGALSVMTLASTLVAAASVTGSDGERHSTWCSLGCGDCPGTKLWSCSPGPPGLLLSIKGRPGQAKHSAAGKPDCLELGF